MSEHETVADIVAEKRTRANEIERDVAAKMKSGKMTSDQYAREVVADLRKEADRIEAAAKREQLSRRAIKVPIEVVPMGNAAAMREALADLVNVIDMFDNGNPLWWHNNAKGVVTLKKARAALSAPPRQCDVGTAEEQDARFGEFCVMRRTGTGSCAGCPDPVGGFTVANGIRECALVWAQVPYEASEISRAHRAGEHNNKPNNEGINNE